MIKKAVCNRAEFPLYFFWLFIIVFKNKYPMYIIQYVF